MKCPDCNGTLYYDIPKKVLKCRHCGNTYDVAEYDRNNSAEETIIEGGRLFTCKNCGAQLICADDEAVTYCSYCGSEAILESQMSGIKRPKYIIPFSISKDRCKEIYEKRLKGTFYIPKEFKDPEFIDRFRPFYIPYWIYKITFRDDPIDLKAHKSYTMNGYDYYEEYEITAKMADNDMVGLPYDASRNFDDSIAEKIAPFSKKGLVRYSQGYLAGMYADAPNVDSRTYEEEVLNKATDQAVSEMKLDLRMDNISLPRRKQKLQEFLGTTYKGEDTIYLPVWFLTWRKGDRVAYAVVNGQTGKIHIDLPADLNVFSGYTALVAGALFVLLTLFVSVTSRFVIWFAALLVYLLGIRYHNELKQIRDRENHVFDKGYLLNDEKELPMSEKKRSRLRKAAERKKMPFSVMTLALFMFVFFFFTVFLISGELYDLLVSQTGAIAMTFIVLFLEVIRFIKQVAVVRYLRNKRSFFICLLALASVIYAFMVAVGEPVQDWWYYLGALICLFAAMAMSVDLILRYNETSTRPLPSFYVRKGGDDRA